MVLFMLRNIHGDYPVGVLLLCMERESEGCCMHGESHVRCMHGESHLRYAQREIAVCTDIGRYLGADQRLCDSRCMDFRCIASTPLGNQSLARYCYCCGR